MDDPITTILARLPSARSLGAGRWEARCPAHDDSRASLSVTLGADGRVLVHCHAKCHILQVMRAMGLSLSALRAGTNGHVPAGPPPAPVIYPTAEAAIAALGRGEPTHAYAYHNADGSEVGRVLRWSDADGSKTIRPIHRTGAGWSLGGMPTPRPLYRLPELLERHADRVYVTEGEKAADAGAAMGLLCTASAHGAASAAGTDWTPLRGRDVAILRDNDQAGLDYAVSVAGILARLAVVAKIVLLPGLPAGGDLVEFVEARDCHETPAIVAEITAIVDATPTVLDPTGGPDTTPGAVQPRLAAPATAPAHPVRLMRVRRLSQVAPTEQAYLWPGRIPAGTCTLIGGYQGATKNLFAYDMIARVTTGKPWPDDLTGTHRLPQNVILLEAEEHISSSIVPRLIAARADMDRTYLIEGVAKANQDRDQMVSIQSDCELIEATARNTGNVGLIVISPITSYLGSVEQNKAEAVRNEILNPLKSLSERLDCAVVLLKHPNKEFRCADPLQRIAGSAAFTEAMRAIVWIGADPRAEVAEKNPIRAAFWAKFSIGPRPDPMSWRVAVADNGQPGIMFEPGEVGFTAEQCLSGKVKKGSAGQTAVDWIMTTLESGPTTSGDLLKAAMEAGKFSLHAFKDARSNCRAAGMITIARKPETDPAQWWVWRSDSSGPTWFVGEETEGE